MRLIKFMALLIGCMTVHCSLARSCVPEEDFNTFLKTFESDRAFQNLRTLKLVTVVDSAGQSGGEDQQTTSVRTTRKTFIKEFGEFPRAEQEGIQRIVKQLSATQVEVHVFVSNSDSYSRYYKFSKRDGCWWLAELNRDSL